MSLSMDFAEPKELIDEIFFNFATTGIIFKEDDKGRDSETGKEHYTTGFRKQRSVGYKFFK